MTTHAQRRIWLVSPYHTGSHRAWAEGYVRHSRHHIELITLEGRFWKWRMQGGALELAALAEDLLRTQGAPDAILGTDMLNVPAFLGLMRHSLPKEVPLLLYMHENQLTYPWAPGEKVDLTYALVNWISQCCAQQIAFNSRFHLQEWFAALPNLLKHFPDYNQLGRIPAAKARCRVLPVGIDVRDRVPRITAGGSPLILWNQRWEYDKRPDRFFALLYRLQEADVPFRLAVAGENFRNSPAEFEEARGRLAAQIVHWGFIPDRAAYDALLASASLVISTAEHEFFGISILEAVAAGAFPLLPRRLSYPELFPVEMDDVVLYDNEEELFNKARTHLLSGAPAPYSLQQHVHANYRWQVVAEQYDAWIDAACQSTA